MTKKSTIHGKIFTNMPIKSKISFKICTISARIFSVNPNPKKMTNLQMTLNSPKAFMPAASSKKRHLHIRTCIACVTPTSKAVNSTKVKVQIFKGKQKSKMASKKGFSRPIILESISKTEPNFPPFSPKNLKKLTQSSS